MLICQLEHYLSRVLRFGAVLLPDLGDDLTYLLRGDLDVYPRRSHKLLPLFILEHQ